MPRLEVGVAIARQLATRLLVHASVHGLSAVVLIRQLDSLIMHSLDVRLDISMKTRLGTLLCPLHYAG